MGRKLSFSGAVGDAKRDWVSKTSNYTAVSGDALLLDSSGGAFTVTLPASPQADDYVDFADGAGSLGTNNVTIGRNSEKICGAEDDLECDLKNVGWTMVYKDSTQGWRIA
tara:strand:- start:5170 stop:5499 length:330 start_codon:yes stop_codon:yes gene_type:complete